MVSGTVRMVLSASAVARLSGVRLLDISVLMLCHPKSFSCSPSDSKRSFYRLFNAIFDRVGHIASEAVTVELY